LIWTLFRHVRSIIPVILYGQSEQLILFFMLYYLSKKGPVGLRWRGVTFGYLISWLVLVC